MEETAGPLLDLRRLRYFVAVAEELHFSRAAERLYITQPVLSRQIRLLEQELGTQLFERSSRDVKLTPPGEQLLEDGRMLLSAAEAARRRCIASAEARPTLTIGFWGHEWIAPALRRFAAEFPDADARLRRIAWDDQIDVLHDGRVDVAFVALPVDTRGLELLPFQTDQRVAVLPVDHPAAARPEIRIDDLADDPVIIQGGATDEWNAFHNVDPRADGSRPVAARSPTTSRRSSSWLQRAQQSASCRGQSPSTTSRPASSTCPWLTSRRSRSVLLGSRSARHGWSMDSYELCARADRHLRPKLSDQR
jgi:DNA-binding transcriptional LysR family regulator